MTRPSSTEGGEQLTQEEGDNETQVEHRVAGRRNYTGGKFDWKTRNNDFKIKQEGMTTRMNPCMEQRKLVLRRTAGFKTPASVSGRGQDRLQGEGEESQELLHSLSPQTGRGIVVFRDKC